MKQIYTRLNKRRGESSFITTTTTRKTTTATMNILVFFGLWIINSIIGCEALPRPEDTENYQSNYAVSYGAPLITPLREDVILEPNTSFTLSCEANETIFWHYPRSDIKGYQENFETNDANRPFGIRVTFTEITYLNVGAYYCIKESKVDLNHIGLEEEKLSQLIDQYAASTIYIFVNDPVHLLAETEMFLIAAHQYGDTRVPCKPTMPDIPVILMAHSNKIYASETAHRYHPQLGFTISLRAITEGGDYKCLPKKPSIWNEAEYTMFNLQFIAEVSEIRKPKITSTSSGHVHEGESFELICEVAVDSTVLVTQNWIFPNRIESDRYTQLEKPVNDDNLGSNWQYILNISNAQITDSGRFICIVTDNWNNSNNASYSMTVLQRNAGFVNVSEPNSYYKIVQHAGQPIAMYVNYNGYPPPTIKWYKPDMTEIIPIKDKYIITTLVNSSHLKIYNVQMTESGSYTVNVSNGFATDSKMFNVTISDKPITKVNNVVIQTGEEAHFICNVQAFPTPKVYWVFTPCSIEPRWPNCNKKYEQMRNSSQRITPGNKSIEKNHEIFFMPEGPGIVHCFAENKYGNTSSEAQLIVSDIPENITVGEINANGCPEITQEDTVTIFCTALAYYYSGDLEFYDGNGQRVDQSQDVEIKDEVSKYSYKRSITFKNIKDADSGNYECRARLINEPDKWENKFISIFVHQPSVPVFTQQIEKPKYERKLGEALDLTCRATGKPCATIRWYRDDAEVIASNHTFIRENGSKLIIAYIKPEDEGLYKCVASNSLDRITSIESKTKVIIVDLPGPNIWWIIFICALILILALLCVFLYIRWKRERTLLRELKAAGLANFEEGAVEHINPAMTLDEQAELLPYDRNFEFPRNKLKLGKQLGAGAFGVVLKAQAEGIKLDEKESVVAVKMVKRTADNEVMRALVSELKIMVHLGQHLNVVNLLGACTKNIAKRELMVIVEYCRYGNVQNFLLRNRKRFINQINPQTGRIDPTITMQRDSDSTELNRNSDNDPRPGTRAGRPNSSGYLRQSDLYEGNVDSGATEQTIMTTVPEDEDNILSNNSIQPAWRSNYKPDSTEAMSVSTSDLVSWAFQVARGMDYLSSRKVLHGDLAARNILLCENNVVKICDFGLARSMYKGDNYKKQGEAPLPIKWLALESLSDHVFSTYTDVWSFGIVLWEFFSLAKVPYPGMDPNQSLYLKLKDGYRMEKPPYANDELYDIMLECWRTNPESRPLFYELEQRFGKMLGDEVTNHYMDLNEPYLRTNTEYMRRTQTDYLALMGSPEEMAPPPPRYVNGHILPEIRIEPSSDDYLQMSTNTSTTIFSPTRPKDYDIISTDDKNKSTATPTNATNSFEFPDPEKATIIPTVPPQQPHSPTLVNNLDSPVNKNRKKDNIIQPEEIPMLRNINQNSDEDEHSPEQNRKFADTLQQTRQLPTPTPRQHIVETKLTGGEDYVNVKSPKRTYNNNSGSGRGPDAFSNPSYQILKTVDGRAGH